MTLILVGGGARSGKSRTALEMARAHATSKKILFIATAYASDDEMKERIQRHQAERDSQFTLVEEPKDLEAALKLHDDLETCVVDCLTLWLSNVMDWAEDETFIALARVAKQRSGKVFFVTNEVGEGIVPMHPVSRKYRDLSGRMNQLMAKEADEVYFLQFGLSQKLK